MLLLAEEDVWIARFLKLEPMANPRTMASNADDEMTMIDSFFLRVVTDEGNCAAVASMLLSVIMMLNVVVLRNQSAGGCKKMTPRPCLDTIIARRGRF